MSGGKGKDSYHIDLQTSQETEEFVIDNFDDTNNLQESDHLFLKTNALEEFHVLYTQNNSLLFIDDESHHSLEIRHVFDNDHGLAYAHLDIAITTDDGVTHAAQSVDQLIQALATLKSSASSYTPNTVVSSYANLMSSITGLSMAPN